MAVMTSPFTASMAKEPCGEIWKLRTQAGRSLFPPRSARKWWSPAAMDFSVSHDIESGKETKSLEIGGNIASTPAVVGSSIFFGTMSNQVIGLNTLTMEPPLDLRAPETGFSLLLVGGGEW
ncbi:MAG: hypothetical protein U1D30_14045 [Planctomycetota bacterium]